MDVKHHVYLLRVLDLLKFELAENKIACHLSWLEPEKCSIMYYLVPVLSSHTQFALNRIKGVGVGVGVDKLKMNNY